MTSRDELVDLAEALRREGHEDAAADTLSIVRIIDTSLDRVGFRKKRLERVWRAVAESSDDEALGEAVKRHRRHLRAISRKQQGE